MLSENIKTIRKSKGLSQEELAVKLNIVRQTISKWEKGLSVPDSDMLISISEALETPVSTLLGENVIESKVDDLKVISYHIGNCTKSQGTFHCHKTQYQQRTGNKNDYSPKGDVEKTAETVIHTAERICSKAGYAHQAHTKSIQRHTNDNDQIANQIWLLNVFFSSHS